MPTPTQTCPALSDTEGTRVPNLSEWLSLAAFGDGVIWTAYAEFKTRADEPEVTHAKPC